LDTLDLLSLLAVAGLVLHWFQRQNHRQRTALLASHLQPFQIERLMQQLTEGYLRALGETDAQRQDQLWQQHAPAEQQLAQQFQDFARAFAQVPAPQARTLKLALPGMEKVWPQASFDTRRMVQLHAEGIARAVANEAGLPPKDRAYRLMAEMFLMQHSCHWFCRSRTVATARMWAQHHTAFEQALAGVSPDTRQAYQALVQGPALGGLH
jgi:citrate synthase